MNKKILSIILSVFFVLTSVATLSVSALSTDDIQIDTLAYEITVTVKSDADGYMVAQLVNAANTELFGIDSDDDPELVNGKYIYEFSFYMQSGVPTGDYKVYVGNNVAEYPPKTFSYVRIGDLIEFYDGLDDVTPADSIDEYFVEKQEAGKLPIDITEYSSLCPEILAIVNSEIADKIDELIAGIDGGVINIGNVTPVDAEFKATFSDLIKVAKIANAAKKSDWPTPEEGIANFETVAEGAVFENIFDDEYYTAEAPAEPVLAYADVFDAFKTEVENIDTLVADDYSVAFDNATLMTIAATKSFATLKGAFLYFEGEGSIAPDDMTDINALIAGGTDTELWKTLQQEAQSGSFENGAALVARAEVVAGEMNVSTPEDGYTPPSTDPVDTPTIPTGPTGGNLGGGSKPITPPKEEEPKPTTTFTDIAEAEWAREAIEALAEAGVIAGKGDGKFAPNDLVTREEYIKMIIVAFDLLEEGAECDFADVAADRWSYDYIATAKKLGVVTGDGENFNPAGQMTRQDMAVIVHRAFEILGIEVSGEAIEFTDGDAIADYAKEAVSILSGAGIINGMGDGEFAPNGILTRAQAAKVIYGLMNLNGGDK